MGLELEISKNIPTKILKYDQRPIKTKKYELIFFFGLHFGFLVFTPSE